ncbi:MAG: Fic family protein [Bacteriovorax sp.]|nr:Fic family protein [Bacteriovorax sp.]
MSKIKKKTEIESHILRLLESKKEINLNDVLESAGLSKESEADKKAVGRCFKELISREVIKPEGAARARVYIRGNKYSPPPSLNNSIQKTTAETEHVVDDSFRGITLSLEGQELIQYVSQPIEVRTPAGYNQNFLRLYEPNSTFYLNKERREKLLKIGTAEGQVRPAGTYAKTIFNRLLIDLSWNSSRLEGNTYSLLETKRLIELGESATNKDASETQMILNHKEAIEFIVNSAEDESINSHTIRSIHALLSENLLGDPSASGRIRKIAVGIGGTTYIPLDNPHVLEECFQIFIDKLNQINDPFEQSFFSLVHLAYMQAFEDVNKRTARLVANIPLIKKNLRPLSFIDVNQTAYVMSLLGVYEKNDVSLLSDLYFWAYERSSQKYSAIQQSMGEPNLLKMKYRELILNIVRGIVLGKIPGIHVVFQIQNDLEKNNLPEVDAKELFKLIEVEIASLHDGNIARFKIRPSEFETWKKLQ